MTKPRLTRYQTILVAVAALVTLFMLAYGQVGGPDTHTYINAWPTIASGHLDKMRTPVYPLFIGLFEAISKVHRDFLLILFQNIVACIALYYAYKIIIRLTKSAKAAFWTVLVMAVLPAFIVYRNIIMTESFAISGSIFLIYCTLGIYDGRSRWNLLGFAFWLLFLIFLRPSFIYMLPVFAVAMGLIIWKKPALRKRAGIALLSIVAVTVALLGYMQAFYNEYGVFSMTSIGTENDVFIMRQSGDLDPSKTNDKALADYITKIYNEHGTGLYTNEYLGIVGKEAAHIYEDWDLVTVHNLVKASKTWKNQLKGVAIRTYYAGSSEFLYPRMSSPFAMFNATIGWIYLLLILYSIWIVAVWRATRHIPWESFLLLMLGGSNVIVAVVGAYGQAEGEWGRLISPSLFIYFIMFAQLSLVCLKKIRK